MPSPPWKISPKSRNRRLLAAAMVSVGISGCVTSAQRRFESSAPPVGKSRTHAAAYQADSLASDSQMLEVAPSHEPSLYSTLVEDVVPTTHQAVTVPLASRTSAEPSLIATTHESSSMSLPVVQSENSEESDGVEQPVDYFVQLALAQHPSLRAARQRVAAEANRIEQARALPDPMFNNTFWPIHDHAIQTAAGRVGNQMSLSQSIPWPEKRRTKAAIVSQEVQVARAEVEQIERQITESVRLAYYEVWYAMRAIEIIEQTRALVDDLTQVAESRYRSGGTQQDVLRIRLEADRLDQQLVEMNKQKQVAQADLAALVQQPVTLLPEARDDLGLNDVPAQLDQLISLAEQCNPELKGLAWQISRDRQKQRLACLQQYPDLQVGLNWGLVNDNDDVISPVANGRDQVSLSFGTTLPIWHEKINAGVREASHRTNSTVAELDAKRDELFAKLRRLTAQANALSEQRDIYERRIIPRSESTLKLSIADYRGKRTDFFSLIETYRELLMFETQLARINASLAGTLAQIERAVGCPQ